MSSNGAVKSACKVRVAQEVDEEVAQRLLDLGVEEEIAEKATYVWPPLDVDTFRYQIYSDSNGPHIFKKRKKRQGEPDPVDHGFDGHPRKREVLEEMRDRGESSPDSLPEPPEVPEEVYDPDLDLAAYVSYRCRMGGCRWQCINPAESGPARQELCYSCWKNPDDVVLNFREDC